MKAVFTLAFLAGLTSVTQGQSGAQGVSLVVGSKKFTESVILGEALTQLWRSEGFDVQHRSELGGTPVLWNGLLAGELDAYVEYTGTLLNETLVGDRLSLEQLTEALRQRGLVASLPLGFNNTYALGMRAELAAELDIDSISDLAGHPDLRLGFGNEFLERADGWGALKTFYGLPQGQVRGLDHDLAYLGLAQDDIQVMDLYSTDASILRYGLRALEDDRGFFPRYDAVVLMRADLQQRAPLAFAAVQRLEGSLDESSMTALNARAKLDGVMETRVAADFLWERLGVRGGLRESGLVARLLRATGDHLLLVLLSLAAAVLVALPLGVLAVRRPAAGRVILGVVGVVQTIPSLALFVFLIPVPLVGGLGARPAIVALFLYSLLPIVRGTHAGLASVSAELSEAARALGLPPAARLRLVELPLAARSILSGVQTAAVINVGTATIAAIVGAEGYGQAILAGIRRDDLALIMEGAIPAAVLALVVQGLFELLERVLVSPGLRIRERSGADIAVSSD